MLINPVQSFTDRQTEVIRGCAVGRHKLKACATVRQRKAPGQSIEPALNTGRINQILNLDGSDIGQAIEKALIIAMTQPLNDLADCQIFTAKRLKALTLNRR